MNVHRHPSYLPSGSAARGSVDDDRETGKLYRTAHTFVCDPRCIHTRVRVGHIFPMWPEHIPLVTFAADMSRSLSCAKFQGEPRIVDGAGVTHRRARVGSCRGATWTNSNACETMMPRLRSDVRSITENRREIRRDLRDALFSFEISGYSHVCVCVTLFSEI